MIRLPFRIAITVPMLLAGSGCLLGPDYERPDLAAQLPTAFDVPEGWKIAAPQDDQERGEWWKRFRSPQLDQLMEQAHGRNQDLAAAVARVHQSRALLAGSRNSFFPAVELAPSVNRTRRSGTIRNAATNLRGARVTNFSLPALLSYEIDFWGELRRNVAAAEADALASDAGLRQATLLLEAELASQFFTLRAIDSEVSILVEAEALRRRALELNRKRFDAGDTDEVDVVRAETELSTTQVDLIELKELRQLVENAIATLVGRPASGFRLALEPLGESATALPRAAPAELLERRPDVAAAERAMIAENARIGIARAAFFPSVRITANAGLESGSVARLFDAGSRTWGFGPEVSLPIFSAGRNRAALKRAEARYDETVARYRQTVLSAVKDVEDALVSLASLEEKIVAQKRTVAAATRTVDLSRRRYEAGLVAYFEVVDAQRTELDARRQAVQFEAARLLASITLIKALGGDWDTPAI